MKKAVVISGLPGAGKGVLARKLAEDLKWKVFSIGDLWRIKHREKYPNNEVSFEEFWKNISLEEQNAMDLAARKIIEQGNAIGEFRFAKLAEGLDCLFVFVTADINVRAKRAKEIGKYGSKDTDEIKEILESRENDEVKIGKDIYGPEYDYRNVANYNVILDSGELNIEEEINIIKGLLNGEELKNIIRKIK